MINPGAPPPPAKDDDAGHGIKQQTRKDDKMSKELLSERGKMALFGGVMWFMLAVWCGSAFWEHINWLKPDYPNATRLGALASEVALLILLLLHCFSKHIGVRRWALVFTLLLGAAALIHAGALRGMKEAQITQINTEQRLAESLGKMSAEQARAIEADQSGTQRERLAKSRAALAQKAEVAKSAQAEIAKTITTGTDKVKEDSILPVWYLNGWMYSVLFIVSQLFLAICFGMMMRDDVDANFDGIADHLQGPRYRGGSTTISMAPQPAARTNQDPKA